MEFFLRSKHLLIKPWDNARNLNHCLGQGTKWQFTMSGERRGEHWERNNSHQNSYKPLGHSDQTN